MNFLDFKTPSELAMVIAENCRKQRKKQNMTMKTLSEKSMIPYSTLKRFEYTGEISLISLLKIAVVLDCTASFEKLFVQDHIESIQEILNGTV